MKVNDWLRENTQQLEKAGIGTARLDCLILLEDATGKNRAFLLAHPEFELTQRALKVLENQTIKRKQHIPLAQIRGKTEFYGREFIINQDVLEPRPESETMIDLLKELVDSKQLTADSLQIADIGTGSGAIAITAKLELPAATVIATDIDKKCLEVAEKNAEKHKTDIVFYKGSLLEALPSTVYRLPSTLLCNLPYVPDSYEINQAALNEPKIAIFGGPDGLDLYRKMFAQTEQIAKNLQKPQYILTESLPFQHKNLAKIAQSSGYKQIQEDDFIQVFTIGH